MVPHRVLFRVVSMLTLRGPKRSVLLQPATEDTLDIRGHQYTAVHPAAPPAPVNVSGDMRSRSELAIDLGRTLVVKE